MCEENSSHVCNCLTAFAIGALVGAGVALLFAPHSGKETRELLAQKAHELKEKAGDIIDKAKEKITEKKTDIAAAVAAGKEAMREQREKRSDPV
jgi:gas vesicle protein